MATANDASEIWPSGTPQASRIDPETGVREEIESPHDASGLFTCTYLPASEAKAGAVICPAFQSEFTRNYRREVLLARSLASRGVAVQRFHYRGTGNSNGEIGDVSSQTMREDAVIATQSLVKRTGVERLLFVATRWGSLIAAASSKHFDAAPIALWEPVVDTRRYFRDLFRMRLMGDLKEGSSNFRSTGAVAKHLKAMGSIDVLGLTVTNSFVESSMNLSLRTEMGTSPRPVLLIQIDTRGALREEYSALRDEWKSKGFSVEVDLVNHSEAWWFGGGNVEARRAGGEGKIQMSTALIERTTNWASAVAT